jgi:hypothetical protein
VIMKEIQNRMLSPETQLIQKQKAHISVSFSADRTGLEPATSCVTGRHSNQLNYRSNIYLLHSSLTTFQDLVNRDLPDLTSGHSNQLNYRSNIYLLHSSLTTFQDLANRDLPDLNVGTF